MPTTRKIPNTITAVDKEIASRLMELREACGNRVDCYPLLLADEDITSRTVDKVFDELQEKFSSAPDEGNLVVVVDSGGGDIDAAYNLALLFRRYGREGLTFIVPRWAKSAATFLDGLRVPQLS